MNQDEIDALGHSLRRINQKLIKTHQDCSVTRLWYQGGEPYFDVFFDCQRDEVIWFQFTFRGQSITWSKRQAELETGLTHEQQTEGSRYAASKLIQTDQHLDGGFLDLAKEILKTRIDEFPFQQAVALLES